MTAVLNLDAKESNIVINFLRNHFLETNTNTKFEKARFKAKGCVITLYNSGKLVLQGKTNIENSIKEEILYFLSQNIKRKFYLGIDESGRSEQVGPFVAAGVLADPLRLKEFRDSKKTKNIAEKFKLLTSKSLAYFSFVLNPKIVDMLKQRGYSMDQIQSEIFDSFILVWRKFFPKIEARVDGKKLKAMKQNAEFIVGGDDKDVVIAAASVYAKFLRDFSTNLDKRKTWRCADED